MATTRSAPRKPPPDQRIGEIAARQHGVVERSQLLAAGLTPDALKSRVRSGALRRLHRGVYILGHLRGPLEPPRAAVMAAVLACGADVVVSHRSAIELWELGPPPARRGPSSRDASARDASARAPRRRQPVDLSFPGQRTPTRRPGIRAHRAGILEPGDISSVDGIPVTSPARTLLDFAAVATTSEFERAVARAERQGLVDEKQLRALIPRIGGRRGARLVRAVVGRTGGAMLLRSEAESRFRGLLRDSTIEEPQANVMVCGYEVDFYWPKLRVAVEVDGFAFHRVRPRFDNDRTRDADLLAAGISTLRFTWDHIVKKPKATLVRLTRVLVRAEDRAEAAPMPAPRPAPLPPPMPPPPAPTPTPPPPAHDSDLGSMRDA